MNRWHSPPAELYDLVEHTPAAVLLESARPAPADSAAPTRLFVDPLRVCIANHAAELPALFEEIERAVDGGLYAAGYFSYECGAFFEPTAVGPIKTSGQRSAGPLAWFGIYERPHLFDHQTGTFPEGDPPGLASSRLNPDLEPPGDSALDCSQVLTEQEYAQRIDAIHEWIRAGDVYQLNFTMPLRVHAPGSSAALYRRLRRLQPAPYGAFLHTQPNRRILSFSPELFFRVESGEETRRITTRPMKGTAPRGRITRDDRALADWLRNDPKNRAENVMIVDLLRNDLGRLCTFGSVRAENLFAVERYPTLWQMTSTITGELRVGINFQQIFRALFPCGSVTGAPKIRAMQLLSELEQRPRGIYTGAIGFFSKQESVFNVAIRTLTLDGEAGSIGVGSGIVIDSKPADEWRECLLKAEFLTRPASRPSPDSFSLVETLLWRGEYPLIEMHLDRLEDSAQYFAFPYNRAEMRAVLDAFGAQFSDRQPRKVRLLLNLVGELSITDELLPEQISEPLRVLIATERTDPNDPMYFHKTTHRPLYARALQAAKQSGYDDVVFLNLQGEVTEGAIHNIFIEKSGRLFTPPIDCGLLPGVHRRHILANRANAEERILTIEDLRGADAIYLSNAVRGLCQATIDWE
jgi:para-aminobenzoate synthetase/4-amino-4-deoxychorismate lyase